MGVYRPFKKVLATSATDTSYPSRIPTLTEPTGAGVIELGLPGAIGGIVPCRVILVPYGLGSDTDAFEMKVLGWRRLGIGPSPALLWIPTPLGSFTCTMTIQTGIAGSVILNTERFCDTIAIVKEPVTVADVTAAGVTTRFSPADDTIGWIEMELRGVEKIEFIFDLAGGTTSANCLFSLQSEE